MWPFCVSSDSGKCLTMLVAVSPGYVLRLPLQIADSSVVLWENQVLRGGSEPYAPLMGGHTFC